MKENGSIITQASNLLAITGSFSQLLLPCQSPGIIISARQFTVFLRRSGHGRDFKLHTLFLSYSMLESGFHCQHNFRWTMLKAQQLLCSHHTRLFMQLKNNWLDEATWGHNFSPNYWLIEHASLYWASARAGSLWFLFLLDGCSPLTCAGGNSLDWNECFGAKRLPVPNHMFQNRIWSTNHWRFDPLLKALGALSSVSVGTGSFR